MRKTIRIVSLILSVILTLSLFFLPVFAEDSLADLKRVYNTLNAYFYTPYYKNSEKFEALTISLSLILMSP